jgi:hypothetical protein
VWTRCSGPAAWRADSAKSSRSVRPSVSAWGDQVVLRRRVTLRLWALQSLLCADPAARVSVGRALEKSVFTGREATVSSASIQGKLDELLAGQSQLRSDMDAHFARLSAQLETVHVTVREGDSSLLTKLLEDKALLSASHDRLEALAMTGFGAGGLTAEVLALELGKQSARLEEALVGVRQGLDPSRPQDRQALEALVKSFHEARDQILQEVRAGRHEAAGSVQQLANLVKTVEGKVRPRPPRPCLDPPQWDRATVIADMGIPLGRGPGRRWTKAFGASTWTCRRFRTSCGRGWRD